MQITKCSKNILQAPSYIFIGILYKNTVQLQYLLKYYVKKVFCKSLTVFFFFFFFFFFFVCVFFSVCVVLDGSVSWV